MEKEILGILETTKDRNHGIEHFKTLVKSSEELIREEKISVDRKNLNEIFLWHDIGKARFGSGLFTNIFDGPISAVFYYKYTRNLGFNWKVFKAIWKHTRALYFLGKSVDRILNPLKENEERVFFDLDLVEQANPVRVSVTENRIMRILKLKSIQPNIFYFDYSRRKFSEYINSQSI